jgi:ribosomal-protein-alanine N-acetyltransferase
MRDPEDSLTTERLALRRFTMDDLELLVRLHTDIRVMRYAGGLLSREQSLEVLRDRTVDYYDQHPGLGVWATLERCTGACIGLHLLNNIRGETHIQVGYLLYPEYWGRGYATEMAVRVLRYGFEALGLPQIVAITDLANLDSQRVLHKAGLLRRGERSFAHPAYQPGPLAWFERDAADWLAQHPPASGPSTP